MVRLEEGRAGGEACRETPPAVAGCQAPPAAPGPPSSRLPRPPPRRLPRSAPGLWESEAGLQASIEWLVRQGLGFRFASLPSLSSPSRATWPLPTAVVLRSPETCWGGDWTWPAARSRGWAPPPAGGDPGGFPDPQPVGLLLPLSRFHVHINPRPWG